jgi:predicted aspartyl protease
MPRAAIKPFVVALLAVAVPAFAQDRGKSIDVFDNQDEMSTSAISIEGPAGAVDGASEFDGATATHTGAGITIHYERNGSAILVPAKVEGKSVYFLFDTGATYTTLSGAFARAAGIAPGEDSPVMMGQTANGPTASRVGLMNRLELGGRSHYGVTFTVCDACPSGMYKGKPIVGLLGLNVIGRYRTSFDDAHGVLQMSPTVAYADRRRDIKPWIELDYGRSQRDGKTFRFVLNVRNRAPRGVKSLKMKFSCAGSKPTMMSKSVRAKSKLRVEQSIESGKCPLGFSGDIVEAKW